MQETHEMLNSIPRSGRSRCGGNGNSLQYSCLGNPMDRGAWWDKAHRVARSLTQLSDQACMHAPPNQRKLKQKPKEHKETTGGDSHVNCLYCGDGFLKSAWVQIHSIVCRLFVYQLYIWIMLLKRHIFKKNQMLIVKYLVISSFCNDVYHVCTLVSQNCVQT